MGRCRASGGWSRAVIHFGATGTEAVCGELAELAGCTFCKASFRADVGGGFLWPAGWAASRGIPASEIPERT